MAKVEIRKVKEQIYKLIGSKVRKTDIVESPIVRCLADIGFDAQEICMISLRLPRLYVVDGNEFIENMHKLNESLNIRAHEYKMLIMRRPDVLLFSSKKMMFQIRLIKTWFGLSTTETLRMFFHFPMFLDFTKKESVNLIKGYTKKINEYEFTYRKIFRQEPRLAMFINDVAKNFLVNKLGLTNAQVESCFSHAPEIMTISEKNFNKIYDKLYEQGYVKQDIKQIVLNCPIAICSPRLFQITSIIEKSFECTTAEARQIFIQVPELILFEELNLRVESFRDFGMSLAYLKAYPQILIKPYLAVFMKFVLAHNLKLATKFDLIEKMKLKTLCSRAIFMQKYQIKDYSDLLLSEQKFNNKYRTDNEKLKDFTFDARTLSQFLQFFAENNNVSLKNLQFSVNDILNYTNEQINECEYKYSRSALISALHNVTFDADEMSYIFNCCPAITYYDSRNITQIFTILKRYGLSREEIQEQILKQCGLLCYNSRDLAFMVDDYASNNIDYNIKYLLYNIL